jgi:hypothetical protein
MFDITELNTRKYGRTNVSASDAEKDGNLHNPSSVKVCVASSASDGGMF